MGRLSRPQAFLMAAAIALACGCGRKGGGGARPNPDGAPNPGGRGSSGAGGTDGGGDTPGGDGPASFDAGPPELPPRRDAGPAVPWVWGPVQQDDCVGEGKRQISAPL